MKETDDKSEDLHRQKTAELVIANEEKAKRAAELVIANEEKTKRAVELVIARAEKAKRAAKLVIARAEKAKRAFNLIFANAEKAKREDELIIADKELVYQNEEKVKSAAELVLADVIKTKLKAEQVIASIEKAKRIAKSIITNRELSFQTEEKSKREQELIIADAEKAKLEAELVIANVVKAKRCAELVIKNIVKAKRSAELVIANKELAYQKNEKSKREAELVIATVEKAKRAAELVIKNIEKAKRAAELVILNKEFVLAKEKKKLIAELTIVNKELNLQIDKRKLTESVLNDSRDEIYRLLNSMFEGIYGIDINGNCTFINKSFLQLLGYQNDEEVLGKNIHELIHHSHSDGSPYPLIECKVYDICQTINSSDEVFWRKDGVAIPVEYRAHPIEKDGVVIGSIVTFNDITERKKSEDLLKESEQKSMSIMENSADAIFITNQQGNYVYTNREVSAMLGYTSEEMKSKTIADITPPDKIEEYFNFFKQILNEGKGFTEIELLKKDGNYISTDLNAVLLPDGTVYGSCRDITERKKAKAELIQAKEHAEESERLKSAFLANMSHEIRTPMNGILGFAQLLREPDLTGEDQQKFLGIIEKSGARMLNIITDIVNISKIESGQMEISISETNLNEQIDFIDDFFKPAVEEKGLQLIAKKALPSKEAIIKTDREKIYAILTNLVGNATKFTHAGSIEFGYEKKGKYLEFFVKDTGDGIADEKMEIIFERFRQSSESLTRNYEGAGLGLSISKAYVEMLGGKIWVESKLGEGSTFYFTIPYNAETEPEIITQEPVSVVYKDDVIKNLKILAVEDDEASELFLSTALTKFDKELLLARNGTEAVEICRNNPDTDLVLMDINMPKMDGYEATRQIRQFNKDVVIIAQTAYAMVGDREKAIASGCNDYISKPIKIDLLRTLIQKHL